MKRYTFFVCSIKFQFYFLSDLPPPPSRPNRLNLLLIASNYYKVSVILQIGQKQSLACCFHSFISHSILLSSPLSFLLPLHYITIGLISIEFFSLDSTENLVLKFMPHLINLSLHTSLEPNIIISVSVHYPSHLILFFLSFLYPNTIVLLQKYLEITRYFCITW